jgi:hypothetical protein
MNHGAISVLAGAARAILASTGGTCLGAAFCTEGGTSGAGGGGRAGSSLQPMPRQTPNIL